MPLNLNNKKIIISAGASGIGWAITKICLSRGAIVYLCDIDIKSLNKIKKHPLIKKRLFTYKCDASNEDEVSNFFNQVYKKTKKIDALINNVGVAGPTGTIEKLTSEDWEQTLKINVISHFYFTKLAIPMLKNNKGGSIINISSDLGLIAPDQRIYPNNNIKPITYSVVKTGILGLNRYLSTYWPKKVRSNAVCFGGVLNKQNKSFLKKFPSYFSIATKLILKGNWNELGCKLNKIVVRPVKNFIKF